MNIIFRSLLIAFAYFIAGKAGSFFAIPPSFASSIWPAAGIGLATALIYGPAPAIIGVYIGSFSITSVNFLAASSSVSLDSFIMPAVIATGSSIEALVGYLLIKKTIHLPIRFVDKKKS